ncbi:MAG: amidohydrolase family protein [Xanthomonadaceae bacterium]|nr:amidohydrolase family protein [Xanthomonadaceae bacterium]MDE2226282.1 amidohydrolase family protein [Xanthomonadaceae bacterium]
MMAIDAHVHFWRIGCNDCAWPPPELTAIHRDFLPEDWQWEADAAGIDAAIVVQSQPSARDTTWLLELARDDARIAGVVGWADLAARDAPDRIAALASHPKLRGLRPMLQDLPDNWILQPAVAPAIEAMIAHHLCFDALVKPRHLPHLLRFAESHPALRIVVDHAAKPDIARGELDPWRAQIAASAERANVSCKLSGLVTEAGERWHPDDLRPYVEHLLATFGPRRLLWGSDWPVVNLAGDYSRWFDLAGQLTHLQGDARAALFGGNAMRVYGIQG